MCNKHINYHNKIFKLQVKIFFSRGQLGHGDLEPEEQPKQIQALTNVKVINIAVGGWHTWVLTEDGELYSWGWNSNGQLAYSLSKCKGKQ